MFFADTACSSLFTMDAGPDFPYCNAGENGGYCLEAGTNFNRSRPGNVQSQSSFAAVTEGRDGHHFVILRVGGGNEAYQIIAPGSAVSDFESSVASLTWARSRRDASRSRRRSNCA